MSPNISAIIVFANKPKEKKRFNIHSGQARNTCVRCFVYLYSIPFLFPVLCRKFPLDGISVKSIPSHFFSEEVPMLYIEALDRTHHGG